MEGAAPAATAAEAADDEACHGANEDVEGPADIGVSGQSVSPCRSGTEDTSSFKKSNRFSDWMHSFLQ